MIYPSIDELSKNRYNRYMLCIATAKCARSVTERYCEQKEEAIRTKDDKQLTKLVSNTEKPVKTAINLLHADKYKVILSGEKKTEETAHEE
ncbi:MAG: hypothetical protein E7588_08140 [Ruminococcaceae bacterium]|nr:hypothetical protein [Oscillospiraceae bacterium]